VPIGSKTSRRQLLKAAVAAGGAGLSAGLLDARDSRPAAPSPIRGLIDVHHHFHAPGIPGAIRNWSADLSLDRMEKHGIATAMLSHPDGAGLICDGTGKGRAATRRINEFGARIVSDRPHRFGLLAALPMRDVDGCLREIEYALDILKADGFGIPATTPKLGPGIPSCCRFFRSSITVKRWSSFIRWSIDASRTRELRHGNGSITTSTPHAPSPAFSITVFCLDARISGLS
jgi:hypothetical protein